jgi:DNA polymerase I
MLRSLYAQMEALVRLHKLQADQLRLFELDRLFYSLEMPLSARLAEMELAGIGLDEALLSESEREVSSALNTIQNQVAQLGWPMLNMSSPEQVAAVLYGDLGLTAPKKRPSQRHASTGEEDLLRLRHAHPLVDLLLMHRTLSKILSTSLGGLRQFSLSDSSGGLRIHCLFNQVIHYLSAYLSMW